MKLLRQTYSDGAGNAIIGVMRYSERNYKLIDVKYYNTNNEQYSGDLFNINSPVLDSNSKPLWEVKTLAQKTIFYDINGIEYNGTIILGNTVTPTNPYTSNEFTSDGTGVVTTSVNYVSGSLQVYVDGTRTSSSRITELTADTYSITNPPDVGSLIITDFIAS